MPCHGSPTADSASILRACGVPLRAESVHVVLDKATERPVDTSEIYSAWNRDRLQKRLASRPEGWALPPLIGGLRLFMLHPTALPDDAFQPKQDPFVAALRRRGYSLVFPAAHGKGGAMIGSCHLLIVILTASSVKDLLDRRIQPWSEFLAAAKSAAIPVFGICISGDALPPPFTPQTVLDLRHSDNVDAAVGEVFPEREVLVMGERGDRTGRGIGHFKASDLAGVRRAIEYLDDTGEFISIRLASGPLHVEADDDDLKNVLGLEHLLDPNRRRLPPAGGGETWPALAEQLRRAGEHNLRAGVEAWDPERIVVRQAGREGGLREPPVIGAPRIFISYRWENLEHEAWVDRLAGMLFSRGYDVTFDRHPETISHPAGPDDSFFRIASSNVFLAVVTDAYVDAVAGSEGTATSWSAREWQEATRLALSGDRDDPMIVGIWRSGSRLPPGLEPGNVLDVRRTPDVAPLLDTMFPELNVIVTVSTRGRAFEVGPIRRRDVRGLMETHPNARLDVRVEWSKSP